RLVVNYKINDKLLEHEIPPLMIQTLVENAIKHGISKLTSGGHLTIQIQEVEKDIQVSVENSGTVDIKGFRAGIGLRNTKKRLALLYGEKAGFSIKSENGLVVTHITLPKIVWHEGNNSR